MGATPPAKYLAEWFARYTKNRDLVLRKLESVDQEEDKVVVVQKDGKTVHYHAEPFPSDLSEAAAGLSEEHKGLLVYNTPENFDSLKKSWKKLAEVPNLTIYFVNPFSKLEKKWIIRPQIHAKISDPESLETGLNSMYAMVEPISKKEVEQLTS